MGMEAKFSNNSNAKNKTYKWNPEFYLMKHFSHYVQPGAVLLETSSPVEKIEEMF